MYENRQIPARARAERAFWWLLLCAVPAGFLFAAEMNVPAVLFCVVGLIAAGSAITTRSTRVLTAEAAAVRTEREASMRAAQAAKQAAFEGNVYAVGAIVVWIVTFVGCWIYCIAAYGFLLGVGLGWLPSLIVATIAAFLWPLIALAAALLALYLWQHK